MALNNNDEFVEAKDYTKHIWVGVIVAVVLMVALIGFQGERIPTGSEVTTKHILIAFNPADAADRARALERIQEIRQRIIDGEKFDVLAEKYSQDAVSAKAGGHIGPQPRGAFDENYEKYVWSAPINELSEIIQSSFGFHLIVVTDRYISPSDEYEHRLDERVKELRSEEEASATPAVPAAPAPEAPAAPEVPAAPAVPAPAPAPEAPAVAPAVPAPAPAPEAPAAAPAVPAPAPAPEAPAEPAPAPAPAEPAPAPEAPADPAEPAPAPAPAQN